MPPDLALEAADTITLYHALVACGSISESDVKRLEPSNFFSDIKSRFLRQADIVDYELDLKKILVSLMASSDLYDLQSALAKVICALQDPQIAQVPPTQLNTQPTRENFRQNLIHLVADLHVQGDLVRYSNLTSLCLAQRSSSSACDPFQFQQN
jgi:ATP-dependent RNA helicase DDX60